MPTPSVIRTQTLALTPCWPGEEEALLRKFEKATYKEIPRNEFLNLICGKILNIGHWQSPEGPARIFYLASGIAVAMTIIRRPDAMFWELTATTINRVQLKRK